MSEEVRDNLPESIKAALRDEGKKFLWISVGLLILVFMNICLTTTVIVLSIRKDATSRQFPIPQKLQRNGN